jgi:hypothetical protein
MEFTATHRRTFDGGIAHLLTDLFDDDIKNRPWRGIDFLFGRAHAIHTKYSLHVSE